MKDSMRKKVPVTVLFLFFCIAGVFLSYCTDLPDKPVFDNPLDPRNPVTGGDPFHLEAAIGDGGILLTWNEVHIPSLLRYKVYRKESKKSSYSAVGTATDTTYTDTAVANGHSYSYKVAAVNNRGNESAITNVAAVTINTAPVIIINNNDIGTASRSVDLTILAYTATQMKISNNRDLTGSVWEAYATTKPWTLETGEGVKTVYLQVRYGGDTLSTIESDEIILDQVPPVSSIDALADTVFTPDLTVTGAASDGLSGIAHVDVSLDNGNTWGTATGTDAWSYIRSSVSRGSYQVISRAVDNAGNVEATKQPVSVYALPVSPTLTTLTADPLIIPSDGTSTATVTVTPKDYNGVVLGAGLHVVLSTTAGSLIGSVSDNGDGSYSQELRSSTNTETAEITANVNGIGITNKIYVEFIFNGVSEMVFVPAGEFQMGDNFNEGYSEELPVHTVYLDAYYIGKYMVTNEQYCLFLNEMGNQSEGGSTWLDINSPNCLIEEIGGIYSPKTGRADHPVVEVSWIGARAYCNWLTSKTGQTYRMPTEAEWEKAARGTDQRRYPWGGNIDGSYANYGDSGDPYETGSYPWTTPVGYYDGTTHGSFVTHDNASLYGAYDMAGNVYDWCSDWYSSSYYQECYNYGTVTNPIGASSGSFRVVRGGAWHSPANYLRCARRNGTYSNDTAQTIGFRCVREY